jgi:hypothetical protein
MRGRAAIRNEMSFGPLDSLGQLDVTKKRFSSDFHGGRIYGKPIQAHRIFVGRSRDESTGTPAQEPAFARA